VEQSIPQRFAEIVARHANRTAISSGSTEWSYAELDQRSNALALQILERSDANSEPVALLMDHGAGLIAAILAVLKTGKIYVALDPNDSIERLAPMLSDSGAQLLIADQTNAAPANSLATGQLSILPFDDDFSTSWTCTNFSAVSPEAGAWLMYTSGSTGTPKGVWENHRGVMHHANVYRELIQLAPDDRLSLLTSCSFAASTTPLFAALLNGATLCPFHVRSRGVERLRADYFSSPSAGNRRQWNFWRTALGPTRRGTSAGSRRGGVPPAFPGALPANERAGFNRNGLYLCINHRERYCVTRRASPGGMRGWRCRNFVGGRPRPKSRERL
jgi:non-ribosomal peptide synthetase component F